MEPPVVKSEPQDVKTEPMDTRRDALGGGEDMAVVEDGVKREGVRGGERRKEELEAMPEPSPTLSPSLFPDEEVRKVVQCLQSLKQLLERAEHTTVSPVGVVPDPPHTHLSYKTKALNSALKPRRLSASQ